MYDGNQTIGLQAKITLVRMPRKIKMNENVSFCLWRSIFPVERKYPIWSICVQRIQKKHFQQKNPGLISKLIKPVLFQKTNSKLSKKHSLFHTFHRVPNMG